jgi:zinc protease
LILKSACSLASRSWLVLLLLVPASIALAQDVPALDVETYALDNGLLVVLSEDHDVPVVRVDVRYRVGSKDDPAGREGMAHLFEHMMLEGSLRSPVSYFDAMNAVGATTNASTNLDRTHYHEELPAHQLPLALWMEADRMGWLLLDEQRLTNQKGVVRNERRQRYEDRATDDAWLTLISALFPEGHPYHHTTIGEHEHVEAVTVQGAKSFYETHYGPGNATLSLVGDFDPQEAREWIDRTLGAVPTAAARAPIESPKVKLRREQVIRQERNVTQDYFWIAWATPPQFAPGNAELDLAAMLLGGGYDSMLLQRLGWGGKVGWIEAYQRSFEMGSIFVIKGTAPSEGDTDEAVDAVDLLLREVTLVPFLDSEVEVARTQFRRQLVDTLSSLEGRAELLHRYAHYAGDPDYLERDLDRYQQITARDLQRAIRKHLPLERRVVLHMTPPEAIEEEEE